MSGRPCTVASAWGCKGQEVTGKTLDLSERVDFASEDLSVLNGFIRAAHFSSQAPSEEKT